MFETFILNRFIFGVVYAFMNLKLLFGELAELCALVINLVDMNAERVRNFASRFPWLPCPATDGSARETACFLNSSV